MADDTRTNGDDTLPDLAAGVAASELTDGQTLLGCVDGDKVLLARVDGEVFAVGATCTHLGGPLAEGVLEGKQIRCPWHHARFALDSGAADAAPAFEPLPCFGVVERDGRLVVTGPRSPASTKHAGSAPERIVIIGGGAAGFACAELLARSGFGDRVTMLSADADRPYDRTFCSKAYLAGNAKRDECMLADADFFGGDGPSFVHAQVASIDTQAREVVTEDGQRHGFDALVMATGAEPTCPDLPGFDGANVHVLRTLKDADTLIKAAEKSRHAAIVGAGFIGLEVAASLSQRGLKVTVVAPDEVPLARVLGTEIGEMIRTVHEKNGVSFQLGRKVECFADGELVLDDDTSVRADMVVVGIGVTPRTELADAAGLALADQDSGGGIAVNAQLETSVEGIYAVGDVASYPDPYGGKRRIRVEHWVHAERQGQHVARVLMGTADTYTDLPFFWSAHFDIKLRYVGHAENIEDVNVDGDIAAHDFTARLHGDNHGEAFVSCHRDQPSLEEEARREASVDA